MKPSEPVPRASPMGKPAARRPSTRPRARAGALLSQRELVVATFLGEDASYATIAKQLGISHDTVRAHAKNILAKVGVRTRHAAVVRLIRAGLQVTQKGN